MKKWETPKVNGLGVQATETSTGNWICLICKQANFTNEVAVKAHIAGFHGIQNADAVKGEHYKEYYDGDIIS